jgi:hypothetical protein
MQLNAMLHCMASEEGEEQQWQLSNSSCLTEFIEEFGIIDSSCSSVLSQLSSCKRARSTFRVVVMGSGIEEKRFPFLLIVEQISLH